MSLASFRPATIVPRDPQCLLPWVCPIISALLKKKTARDRTTPGPEEKKKKNSQGPDNPRTEKKKKKNSQGPDNPKTGKKKSFTESRCPFSLRTVIRLAIVQLCASHYRQFVTETGTVVLLLSSLACGHFGPHRLAHKSWAVFCLKKKN